MKILFFGDIHNQTSGLNKIQGKFDYLLITGDFTVNGGAEDAQKVLDGVKQFYPALLAVSGNMDKKDIDARLFELKLNLHGKGVMLNDSIGVFGCGGSSPTPFNTPNELSDDKIVAALEEGYKQVEKARIKIMVCHTPPKNTPCDALPNGMHVGSQKVREFIEKHEIDFCLTGHIHEGVGQTVIGKTMVANPGPFLSGNYGILDTDAKSITLY